MTVTADCLRAALVAVQHATEQWVRTGIFPHGVLTRLKLWISGLPDDREQLAAAIAEMAAKVGTNTGADVNGVALDQGAMPSLESLVLYYSKLEPRIFASALVKTVQTKLAAHNGPLYSGPWP